MSTTRLDFGASPSWQRWVLPGALVVSAALHLLVAKTALPEDGAPPPRRDTWVELAVVPPPPPPEPVVAPPPPEPEPAPEPKPKPKPNPKPKPKPEPEPQKVDFDETTTEPQPEDAPPTTKPVRRVVGLSASSFAEGSGSGTTARAGTTLGSGSKSETMSIDEAKETVAYGAVATRPRCSQPPLTVPEDVIADGVEGQVKVVFDVDGTGRVQNVRLTRRLHPSADAACVAAWKQARCKPGKQGKTPVTVTNMPYYCTFKAID